MYIGTPMGQRSFESSIASFTRLLQQCATSRSLTETRCVHARIKQCGLEQNPSLANSLIWTYDKCGSPTDATMTFHFLQKKVIKSWNMMIGCYAQHGQGRKAIDLFKRMQKEGVEADKITLLNVLNACNNELALKEGKLIHAYIVKSRVESHVAIATALLNMYGKCGSVKDAHIVFSQMCSRNIVSWTAMIATYVHCGLCKEALDVFAKMQEAGLQPNLVTCVTVLSSCTTPEAVVIGQLIHSLHEESRHEMGQTLGAALVSMYCRCGNFDDARHVFEKLSIKSNVVLWTAMITACTHHGRETEALHIFGRMVCQGINPNMITFASTLDACGGAASLGEGNLLHAYIVGDCLEEDLVVSNALVSMYSQCGSAVDAYFVFKTMSKHDMFSWNAMLSGSAHHGQGKEAVAILGEMQREGVIPDNFSLMGVLSACGHAGLVDEACFYFDVMDCMHGIKPSVEHYRCVLDLLSRVGQLDVVGQLIRQMPYRPCAMAWSSFLGACRVHGNLEHGKCAAKYVLELNPQDVAACAMIYDIDGG